MLSSDEPMPFPDDASPRKTGVKPGYLMIWNTIGNRGAPRRRRTLGAILLQKLVNKDGMIAIAIAGWEHLSALFGIVLTCPTQTASDRVAD